MKYILALMLKHKIHVHFINQFISVDFNYICVVHLLLYYINFYLAASLYTPFVSIILIM